MVTVTKAGTAPVLVCEVEDSLIPVDFQRKDFAAAIKDIELLRRRLGGDAGKVVPALSGFDGSDFDRVMTYYQLLSGNGMGFDDFSNMGFLFRDGSGICDELLPHEIGINAKFYQPCDEVCVSAHDSYFDVERSKLKDGSPSKDVLRARILKLFDTSYRNIKRALILACEEQLGVDYEIEEQDGVLTARQRVSEYADPVYVLRKIDSYSSNGAGITVQRYKCAVEMERLMGLLKGEPAAH